MIQFLSDLVHNEVLMSAALSWILAQIIKTIIHLSMTKKFVPERLIGPGTFNRTHLDTLTQSESLKATSNYSELIITKVMLII